MTRLRRSGFSPRLRAIAGIDTAIIVESSPSMKKAQPTISGIRKRRRGSISAAEAAPGSLTVAVAGSPPPLLLRRRGGSRAAGGRCRGERRPVAFGEHRFKRGADFVKFLRVLDLMAEQVLDVEHVDDLLAVGRDLG